jgi:hypothetical protein
LAIEWCLQTEWTGQMHLRESVAQVRIPPGSPAWAPRICSERQIIVDKLWPVPRWTFSCPPSRPDSWTPVDLVPTENSMSAVG